MHIHVFDLRRSGARYGARYGAPFRGQQPPSRSWRDGDTESRRRSAENWERHKVASSPQRFLRRTVVPRGTHEKKNAHFNTRQSTRQQIVILCYVNVVCRANYESEDRTDLTMNRVRIFHETRHPRIPRAMMVSPDLTLSFIFHLSSLDVL